VYVIEPATVETRSDAIDCEVRRSDIDRKLVEDVERTIRLGSRTLGLDPPPKVRWLPADTKNLRGIVFGHALSEIWVKIQDRDRARDSALHELRHVWQLKDERYLKLGLLTMEQRQRDADNFAATWSLEQVPPMTPGRAADQEKARRVWELKYGHLHRPEIPPWAMPRSRLRPGIGGGMR